VAPLAAASALALLASRAEGLPSGSSELAAATSKATGATAACTPQELSTLGGGQANAIAISSNGLVVGYAEDASGTPQPVLWKAARPTRISTGLINVSPTGVNSRGEVVGTGVDADEGEEVGWHWADGKLTRLKAPAGKEAVPEAINDSGRIAGALAADDDGEGQTTPGEAPAQAAMWASATAPAHALPALPGDVGAHVYGLNKNGTMVGNSQGPDHFTPAVWDAGGHVTALPGLGGKWGVARAVDDTGVAVGAAVAATGGQQAMTWDVGRRGHARGWSGGRAVQAIGLAQGSAVGQVEVREPGDLIRTHAVRWDASGKAEELPPLSGHPGAGVNAASSAGLVVGFSSDERGARHATLWKCGS
jgi:uncharacterized membrane protein